VKALQRATLTARGPVVLDLQAIQNPDYAERGVARHTFEFARALSADHPDLVGAMLLNPDLPAPGGIDELLATGKVAAADQVRLSGARIYHVIAPFEIETTLDRIWPPAMAAARLRLVVTLHDLIPRVFPDRYHADPGLRRRYLAREELIRAADRVLSVSEATKQEAVRSLRIAPRRIRVIGAGISDAFHRPGSRDEAFARARDGLTRLEPGFLFYVGGIDHRKNVEGLLRGYAQLPAELRGRHQLVVAFRMAPEQRSQVEGLARRLGIAARLYLPGYVDDPTLIAAYQATDLFVFPSLYEGYGLPVVEAMACGAPVVASGTSAIAELTVPEATFDPTDPAAIADAMERALTDPATAEALRLASERPPPTWAEAAGKAAAVYRELLG
jgi:glycosyltransferase involved in cell wall biosynthesis